jgi:hypothetical protein
MLENKNNGDQPVKEEEERLRTCLFVLTFFASTNNLVGLLDYQTANAYDIVSIL